MPETKALIPLDMSRVIEIFSDEEKCDKLLNEIEKYARSITFDTSTAKGREANITHAAQIGKARKALEDKRKELTKEKRDYIKQVNEIGKKIDNRLKPLQKEIREPVTVWEEKDKKKKEEEAERVAMLKQRVEEIAEYTATTKDGALIELTKATSEELEQAIEGLKRVPTDKDHFDEFEPDAKEAKNKRLSELKEFLRFTKEKEEVAAKQKEIDEENERLASEKQKLEDDKAALKRKEEEQEARRQAILREKVDKIKSYEYQPSTWLNAPYVQSLIDELSAIEINESFEEYQASTLSLKNAILQALKAGKEEAVIRDKELEEKRKKEAEKEAEEEAERKIKAKQKKEEEEKAQRLKIAGHKKKIYVAIANAFVKGGVSKENTIQCMNLLIQGSIPHITIEY